MSTNQPNNPLQNITLAQLLDVLVAEYGFSGLATYVEVKCFMVEPSIKSSLKFLRKTPWARQKVEDLYIAHMTSRA
jgi:uncharacterized protein (DUF2132 family)